MRPLTLASLCRALLGKVFEPHDAPVIPVPNCTNERVPLRLSPGGSWPASEIQPGLRVEARDYGRGLGRTRAPAQRPPRKTKGEGPWTKATDEPVLEIRNPEADVLGQPYPWSRVFKATVEPFARLNTVAGHWGPTVEGSLGPPSWCSQSPVVDRNFRIRIALSAVPIRP